MYVCMILISFVLLRYTNTHANMFMRISFYVIYIYIIFMSKMLNISNSVYVNTKVGTKVNTDRRQSFPCLKAICRPEYSFETWNRVLSYIFPFFMYDIDNGTLI